MTKAALAGLTRGLARDLAPRGITVNVIQPGPTATDINDNDEMRARIRPLLAIGRLGEDTEVASLVAYLARPEASFVTGSAITIDGGYLSGEKCRARDVEPAVQQFWRVALRNRASSGERQRRHR